MAASATSKAAKVVGRYVLHEQIATGGMATVRVGRFLGPAGFTRTVAIKQLHPQYAQNPEFAAMFLDEAHLASRIRHPNVVPVLDVVSEEGQLLLVMEYVPGASLARLLRLAAERNQHVPPSIAAAIMTGVLHGLHAAHEARDESNADLGVVHRDVSPQNIMVGADGIPRVVDFGVAKAAGRAQTTRDGQLKGKMAYMAPEQLQGRPIDRRTDIYAAAVVLWETLTGDPLFAGDNDVEVFGKVLAGVKVKPSALATGLEAGFDDVVMRGLSLAPEGRFDTARDMAQALARSVEVATPADVSDWVAALAQDELAVRAARVADVESGTVVSGETARGAILARDVAPPLAESPPTEPLPYTGVEPSTQLMIARAAALRTHDRKRGEWMLVAAVAALLLVGVVLLVVRSVTRPAGEEVRPATAAPLGAGEGPFATSAEAPPPAVPSPRPASPSATPAASASPSSSTATGPPREPPPPAPNAAAGKVKPRVVPKAPAKPKADCDPPYYFDSSGTKRYKRECN